MKIIYVLILSLVLITSSCVSYKVEKFFTQKDNNTGLVPLVIEPDLENFISKNSNYYKVISKKVIWSEKIITGRYAGTEIKKTVPRYGDIGNLFGIRSFSLDDDKYRISPYAGISPTRTPGYYEFGKPRLSSLGQDAAKLINKELNGLPPGSESEARGYIRWRISKNNSTATYAFFVPSLLTLGILNLFGFPVGYQTAELELQIDILDKNKTPISSYSQVGTYVSKGESSAFSAMYWGYSMVGGGVVRHDLTLTKAANMKAFSIALQKIKKKINKDAHQIKIALNERRIIK